MFNRSYQLRAVRKAGGGHKVAAAAGKNRGIPRKCDLKATRLQGVQLELAGPNVEISHLSDFLPWGGIFEPWRPWVLVAAAAVETAARAENAANRCKNRSRRQRRLEAAGQIRLPDMAAEKFTPRENVYTGVKNFARKSAADSAQFPPLAPVTEYEADRPLSDLFPEAYL